MVPEAAVRTGRDEDQGIPAVDGLGLPHKEAAAAGRSGKEMTTEQSRPY